MRKELLAVTIAGVFLGILVAFGIWRANNALKANPSDSSFGQVSKIGPSPTPNNGFPLTIAKPEENDVLVDQKVTIAGITKPSARVIISGENEDYLITSNGSGEFEQEVELVGGANQILIKAFSENGEQTERQLTLIYSSEFTKEASK